MPFKKKKLRVKKFKEWNKPRHTNIADQVAFGISKHLDDFFKAVYSKDVERAFNEMNQKPILVDKTTFQGKVTGYFEYMITDNVGNILGSTEIKIGYSIQDYSFTSGGSKDE